MRKTAQHIDFAYSAITLAVLVSFIPTANAADEEVAKLISPDSGTVSVGVGHASGDSKDRSLYGIYNGQREHATNLLLDIDYVKRDNDTGTWIKASGNNLGLDDRDLSFTYEKQGDLKVGFDYSELTRHDPRTINTGLVGAGSTTPTVTLITPGAGVDTNLKIQRKDMTLTLEKEISHGLQFEGVYKQDDKEGARIWGRGFACSATWVAAGACTASTTQWALLMLPEPINSTTRQIEMKLNLTAEKYALSAGYSGSFFNNSNSTLTPGVPASLNNPLGASTVLDAGLRTSLGLPMYLPPDNQAHEVFLMGNYSFSPTIKGNYKAAYTHATQNQDFTAGSSAPAGVGSLDGELNTTFLQAGLTARPMPKLTLKANLQYDNKDDKTPIALYNTENTSTFTNGHISDKKIVGKLEASYLLPQGYRATLGANYESQDRGSFVSTDAIAGLTAIRQKNDETGVRAELRKSMSETVTGALSFETSNRHGSTWLRPCTVAGCAGATTGVAPVADSGVATGYTAYTATTGGFPATMVDRDRYKWRASADWTPMDKLQLTFMADTGMDTYIDPGSVANRGLQNNKMSFYGVDLSYVVNDMWKLTGYMSHGVQDVWVAHSSGYVVDLKDTNDAFGLGLKGKPTGKIEVSAGFSYANDRNRYKQSVDATAPTGNNLAFYNYQQTLGGMPDIVSRQIALTLSGKYALDKTSFMKVDYVYQQNKLDEWTWVNPTNGTPFTYSDGTTVSLNPKQTVNFVGISYINKFK